MNQVFLIIRKGIKTAFFAAILVVIVIIIICVVGFLRECYFYNPTKTVVIHNYYRAVKLDQRIENDDMSLTKELYGEPLVVKEEPFNSEKLVYLCYDGFAILFRANDQRVTYYGFELYSPEKRIRKDIFLLQKYQLFLVIWEP